MLGQIIKLGKNIYNTSNPRELHRFVVFVCRSVLYWPSVKEMLTYFGENDARRRLLSENAFPIEQMTRAFFYARSTISERRQLIMAHYSALEEKPENTQNIQYGHQQMTILIGKHSCL